MTDAPAPTLGESAQAAAFMLAANFPACAIVVILSPTDGGTAGVAHNMTEGVPGFLRQVADNLLGDELRGGPAQLKVVPRGAH